MLYDILDDNGYFCTFVTPTNKAKLSLESKGAPGRDAQTIHSLLHLTPNLNILDFDASQLSFNFDSIKQYTLYDVLIVDECSMINEELYDSLTKIYKKSKIIFSGDPRQLYSVKENHISKTFSNRTLSLTKIYRQSEGKLYKVFDYLRNKPLYKFKNVDDESGSITVCDNINKMLSQYSYLFKLSEDFKDSNLVKLISYTNSRVNALNGLIRRYLGHTEEYVKGDILVGYDSTMYRPISVSLNTKPTIDIQIDNSQDYIVLGGFRKTWRGLNTWYLRLQNINGEKFFVEILSKDNDPTMISNFAHELELLRMDAVIADKKSAPKKWRKFFNLYNAFLTPFDISFAGRVIKRKSLDYGYCTTVHKVQGSQYSTVMIDMENLWRCKNPEELRQLQYVACTRTTSNLIIYQKNPC